MAVINKQFGFVFLAEPHTGSRAVRDALLTLEGSVETNGDHHLDLLGCYKKGFINEIEADEFTVFAAIRNPYDLLVTRWWYHARNSYTFREWITDIAWIHEQREGTLFWRSRDFVDFFVRHETLDVGVNTILDGCDAPSVVLDEVGRTIGKPDWTTLWYPELDQLARGRYQDIERYGYRARYEGLDCKGVETDGQVITHPR